MKLPLIFDIKRASTADGPGLRTVVFFKGCNLDCFWCHNPEGKSPLPQLAYFKDKCTACGACRRVCVNREACVLCGACAETCPTEARRLYGIPYDAEELMAIFLADKPYFDACGGGVTFSGGECMLYPEAIAYLARRCHEEGIAVAVDTAGDVPFSSFERVLPFVDLFLYDVKALDPALHQKGTGVKNGRILANLEALCNCGAKVLVRIPVIPDFNAGEEVARIRAYCEERSLLYEELAYHSLGVSKQDALQ